MPMYVCLSACLPVSDILSGRRLQCSAVQYGANIMTVIKTTVASISQNVFNDRLIADFKKQKISVATEACKVYTACISYIYIYIYIYIYARIYIYACVTF